MKEAERKRKILYHQHLTSRCDAQTAARDVLALQAQFLRHAQMSLRLRTRQVLYGPLLYTAGGTAFLQCDP